jgi:hypothetical protein
MKIRSRSRSEIASTTDREGARTGSVATILGDEPASRHAPASAHSKDDARGTPRVPEPSSDSRRPPPAHQRGSEQRTVDAQP